MSEDTGLLEKLGGMFHRFATMEPERPKPEEINEQTVAEAIVNKLGFIGARGMKKWEGHPFALPDILNALGFEDAIQISGLSIHSEKYRPETIATRRAVSSLVDQGALRPVELTTTDTSGEDISYAVINDSLIRKIATSPSSSPARKI